MVSGLHPTAWGMAMIWGMVFYSGFAQPAPVSIPVELHRDLPFLKVSVGDTALFFRIDCQALQVLDEGTALALGLRPRDPQLNLQAWNARLGNVQVGPVPITQNDFVVLSLAPIREGLNLPALDGLLGYDLFRRFVVQLDYPAQKMRLFPAATPPAPGWGEALPMRLYGGQLPQISATIEGQPVSLLLDTGSPQALTLYPSWTSQQVFFKENVDREDSVIIGYDLQGPVWGTRELIQSFQVGEGPGTGVSAFLLRRPTPGTEKPGIAGTLGGAWMKERVLTFDFKGGRIWIQD